MYMYYFHATSDATIYLAVNGYIHKGLWLVIKIFTLNKTWLTWKYRQH